ncbi:MAG: asparagine synthetase B family protein [Ignavibacteriae bacterium]|nr:asparagine synthetase B family protein [Ignavibacteriota bacterium]
MKTSIIPQTQRFALNGNSQDIDHKAICIFAATGFFLGEDTYFTNKIALQPATDYIVDENGYVAGSEQYWKWNYDPSETSFKQVTEEFAELFEKVCKEKLSDKDVILPLSGGLDSRTQSVALPDNFRVKSYSYKFQNSFDETKYGREISKVRSYPYSEFIIPEGYLWKCIDKLSGINKCYADFTSPRQMAVIDEVSDLGDVFFLGHWGDVLFDDMGVEDILEKDEIVKIVIKKIIKKSGFELADSMWECWGLGGKFKDHLEERISALLDGIKIENANSKIRAFKSMYWAPRWTSANIDIFSSYKPVVLPYYDDEICKFVCRVPEKYLSGRQIQINYIKLKNPEIAKIAWQDYAPMNLYNYRKFDSKMRLPFRAVNKGKRLLKEKLLKNKLIQRNWEIQFLGEENSKHLKKHLFQNKKFSEFLSTDLVESFYDKFLNEDVKYSHSVNMLLVLSMFCKNDQFKNQPL